MNTRTLQVFTLDELDEKVRERILRAEEEDAWSGWAFHETDELLHVFACDLFPGTDNLRVTAWDVLHSLDAVVECDVVDAARFGDALGCTIPEDAYVEVIPVHGRGQWVGESRVRITTTDDEGNEHDHEDEALTAALQTVVAELVHEVRERMEDATSPEALAADLTERGALFLADGHRVDHLAD